MDDEARHYYSGLPSSPLLLYRSSAEARPWTPPIGPEAYTQKNVLRPVFNHPLNVVWTAHLGPRVCQLLDSQGVRWTSIDVVRLFKEGKGEVAGPVVLWIGIDPGTLSSREAQASASRCLGALRDCSIFDVEVEFRESSYLPLQGPNLLKHAAHQDHDVHVRSPLTPTLGLSIAAQARPNVEGTGGLYIAEGNGSKRIFLLTARHVLFPLDQPNIGYAYGGPSAPRQNVLLLGTNAFISLQGSIEAQIAKQDTKIQETQHWMLEATAAGVGTDPGDAEKAVNKLLMDQLTLESSRREIQALQKFRSRCKNDWSEPSQRILGHVVQSPLITSDIGEKAYTQDYALVELYNPKIEDGFEGNAIDLGTLISRHDFTIKMYPRADAPSSFRYPWDRLLRLRGVLTYHQMLNPDMLDSNNEPCLLVIKNGSGTGVTIGRATGLESYVRQYFSDQPPKTSLEWAILPYDRKSEFSCRGDSGSIIADGRGLIGGILTSGSGRMLDDSIDITYATPFHWLLDRIKANGFPHAHANPTMG